MNMKYFKDAAGAVYAYESDGSQDAFIKPGLVPMSDADAQTYLQSVQQKATVPTIVTAAQGGIALIQAGLMDAVQAVADAAATPAEVKWAWTHATTWDRDSQALAYLANGAGITNAQMDELFVTAAQIVA